VGVLLRDTAGLDLARTLDSGQAFRWRWNGPVATAVLGRRAVRLVQEPGGVRLLDAHGNGLAAAVRRYLGVLPSRAHPRRAETVLREDRVLARILPHTSGISLLAQDPWETLISFIISQNNNIPKIMRSIEGLSHSFGEPLGHGFFTFPGPDRLAAARPRALAACSLGYRAPYVRAAARLVADGRLDLAVLARAEFEAARETLLAVPGVGAKVGDCVLLFGLGHRTAFPVDVWVRRAVEQLYFRGRPQRLDDIQAFARARFGPHAGYAQQHLFAYARSHLRP
jgi:N-glycosylase/DNA lyase